MNHDVFVDLFKLGLKPIPLKWDTETKSAESHWIAHSEITDANYTEATFTDWVKTVDGANGLALKLFSPFGCIDFDLKNTDDKSVYDIWLKAINSQDDELINKICVEKTRNGGYHVYIKYSKLSSKLTFARSETGGEVIAIYTGGTLSYCDPTPGYEMIVNDFSSLEELTDYEYDILTSCAATFDKYTPVHNSERKDIIKGYPQEYENICLQFDTSCTDEVFSHLINELGLVVAPKYKTRQKDKFTPYLRTGSKAIYSAKAYYGTKNLQLFTSSIPGFPSFNDRVDKDDTSWNLSPTRIIYYKNDRDWINTIDEIKLLCDSAGIELIEQQPVTKQALIQPDRLKFPYDIFPAAIQNFINCQVIQHEYLAGAALGVMSTIIGNSAQLNANGGYIVKPIIYLAIVAPPGAAKTPAFKAMYKPLEDIDNVWYKEYIKEKEDYIQLLAAFKNQPKGGDLKEPKKPIMTQTLIKDSTIEMVIKILSFNNKGCCILADELSGFLKRMNRYGDNDELQKWLEMWSGSPILMQRIGRDEDKVQNPFCSIVGGIQPGVLDALSAGDNEHNGFYHRFLFMYPEQQKKPDWAKRDIPITVMAELHDFFGWKLGNRDTDRVFYLSEDANALYAEWFNYKNIKYNAAQADNVKGVIAKYQDYCLRFALIIQVMNDEEKTNRVIDRTNMERAIRLTEYFLGNMNKSMKILAPVTPVDKLTGTTLKLYKALPQSFTAATAVQLAAKCDVKEDYCRATLRRWIDAKPPILTKSGNQKSAFYDKIY